MKNTLALGQLELFRFMYKLYVCDNQDKNKKPCNHKFLKDFWSLLRTYGEPETTFILSDQVPSSAHYTWFIL